MFIKHQKIMTPDKILLNSVLITLIVFVFDNIIISDHPTLLEDAKEKKYKNNSDNIEDFENELSDEEINDIIHSYDTDIDSHGDNRQTINVNMKRQYHNPQREYYDTDMILY
jgi:CBS-domain-containing membrane protein